jgi:hypothetical protein
VVHISEVSGEAYITCTNASSASAFAFPTRVFTGSAINDVTADIDGTGGAETVYALGTFAFQSHRWIWGFGSGAVVGTGYRPDLLRFGGPMGGGLAASGNGSITVGHSVRNARENIVGVCVAGDVAYVGTSYSLWPIIGFGRDTWDKSKPLDESFGFIGPKCAVSAGGVCYYWSSRGPMRVSGLSRPEPLWDLVPATVQTVVDPEKLIAAFDPTTDQVVWFYRGTGVTGNTLVCAYDIRRNVFLGPDRNIGVKVGAATTINPVNAPNATAAAGPSGPPTTATTTSVSGSSAVAGWTNGDATAATTVEVRPQGGSSYTVVGSVAAGATSINITGLAQLTAYEWRAYHLKNGQASAYLGPVAGSQFTTTGTLNAPTGLTLTDVGPTAIDQGWVRWTNSADSGQSTEVYLDDVYYTTVGVGVSSAYVTIGVTGTYAVKVRHIKSGLTSSAYAGPASSTLTYSSEL